MNLPHRRKFLHLAAGAAALPAVSRIASAQAYPVRPVHLVVGFAAGGGSDITARLIGQALSERLGQPFILENRPGASGNTATEAVVRAPPNGYTLLLVGTGAAINASLYEKLSFNLVRDIAPVAGLNRLALAVVVNPSVPVKTISDFIVYAKANPGKVNLAASGVGTTTHMAGELFNLMTGLKLAFVPYRGSAPALIDLISGQVQAMFIDLPSSVQYIKGGSLRALAVTTDRRSDLLPGVPTVAEFIPGYEASNWFGIGAPRNTPVGIIDNLNKEINGALANPRIKAQFAELGSIPIPMTAAEFGRLMSEEPEKWAAVIRAAKIKVE
jgi:tripartite-type tricarboxylate transporter receptor subunit TctC